MRFVEWKTEMSDLKARLENLEVSGAKRAVSVNGLILQGTKGQKFQQIENFFL